MKFLLMQMNMNDKECHLKFVIPCFIFEISTILYDWLMMSFCFQNVKNVYQIYCFPKEKFSSIKMPFY